MSSTLTILTFHGLEEARSETSFPPARFVRLVEVLSAGGYQVMPLNAAAEALRTGVGIPERPLVITFDDGYESVYQAAFPVLRDYRMPATVFLTVGDPEDASWPGTGDSNARLPSMNGRSMLSWGEIREMQRAGIGFGAHTLTHPDLTQLSPQCIEREIVTSKAILEEAIQERAAGFAYPFGRYDARSLLLARQHFSCAVSDRLGLVSAGDDLYALPRVDGYYLRRPGLLGLLATPWLTWYIRACNVPRTARRAVQKVLS